MTKAQAVRSIVAFPTPLQYFVAITTNKETQFDLLCFSEMPKVRGLLALLFLIGKSRPEAAQESRAQTAKSAPGEAESRIPSCCF